MAGFFIAAGNTSGSHLPAMTLDTQMTLALLQELLLALRANDAEGFKGWMALGLEELGRQILLVNTTLTAWQTNPGSKPTSTRLAQALRC
jgi:hypothetical protein